MRILFIWLLRIAAGLYYVNALEAGASCVEVPAVAAPSPARRSTVAPTTSRAIDSGAHRLPFFVAAIRAPASAPQQVLVRAPART